MKVVIIDHETGEILSTKHTTKSAEIGTVIQSPDGGRWVVVMVEHPVVHLLVENAGKEREG